VLGKGAEVKRRGEEEGRKGEEGKGGERGKLRKGRDVAS